LRVEEEMARSLSSAAGSSTVMVQTAGEAGTTVDVWQFESVPFQNTAIFIAMPEYSSIHSHATIQQYS
jgi:hypothetical protein